MRVEGGAEAAEAGAAEKGAEAEADTGAEAGAAVPAVAVQADHRAAVAGAAVVTTELAKAATKREVAKAISRSSNMKTF